MDKLIKKLETIVKYTKDTRINVDITDLQKLIQEIKNQDKIINEMAKEILLKYQLQYKTVEDVKRIYEQRCK
jgi:fructose-1-phosphate kinase PfkB-like protein